MKILITGGSGSGKSAFAEEQVVSFGEAYRRFYLATMFPYDRESEKRVARHREMRRGKGFETIERYTDIGGIALPPDSVVLLECMSNLVANEMFMDEGAHDHTVEAVTEGVERLAGQAGHLVVVTNEIFSEAAAYQGDTRKYQAYLGKINQSLAASFDAVYEVVYGIPVRIK